MIYYLMVCLLSALWAAIELLSRYKDEPFKVLLSSAYCFLFVGLNAVVSGLCYAYLSEIAPASLELVRNVCLAAFGAPLVLRSRLFDIRSGDRIVQVGPGFLIDEFLRIVDRQIDRKRAIFRFAIVTAGMKGIDFETVKGRVHLLVTNSLQHLSQTESATFKKEIEAITTNTEIEKEHKAEALGFAILDLMGEKFFTSLMEELKAQ
jgi:hypothetical protein